MGESEEPLFWFEDLAASSSCMQESLLGNFVGFSNKEKGFGVSPKLKASSIFQLLKMLCQKNGSSNISKGGRKVDTVFKEDKWTMNSQTKSLYSIYCEFRVQNQGN